jgi:hypothetical protein
MQNWVVYLPPEATKKDIETPEFWMNIAARFRAPARLTIMAEDGSWVTDAICMSSDRNWAKVRVLSEHPLSRPSTEPLDTGMEAKWQGPSLKWCVIRKADGDRLHTGCQTREEAEVWLRTHRDAMER